MATEYKPTAFKTISNVFAMTIEVSNTGEQVRYRMEGGSKTAAVSRWLKIYYTKKDATPYFMAFGRRHSLNEFERLN